MHALFSFKNYSGKSQISDTLTNWIKKTILNLNIEWKRKKISRNYYKVINIKLLPGKNIQNENRKNICYAIVGTCLQMLTYFASIFYRMLSYSVVVFF